MLDDLIKTNNYPELQQFKVTIQDPEWHAEGDVYIHTLSVLNELENFMDDCTNTEKKILRYAAAFHDYGKPRTTVSKIKNDKERIVAPYHEEVGSSLLFYAPKPPELEYNEWYQVINLIRYHDKPKKLIINNTEYYQYFNLARKCDLNLLYILEKADIKGRICSDFEEQDEILELFKMQVQEFQLDKPIDYLHLRKEFEVLEDEVQINKVFLKALHNFSTGKIKSIIDELPRSYNYYKNNAHVTVYCGLSSSGKSTLINEQLKQRSYKLISLDDIRLQEFGSREDQRHNDEVRRIAHEQLKQHLRDGDYVIYDATNIKRDFRNKIISTCMNYDAFVNITIPSERDISTIIKDNRTRKYSVPEEVITKQYNGFELPDLDEAHCINYSFLNKLK